MIYWSILELSSNSRKYFFHDIDGPIFRANNKSNYCGRTVWEAMLWLCVTLICPGLHKYGIFTDIGSWDFLWRDLNLIRSGKYCSHHLGKFHLHWKWCIWIYTTLFQSSDDATQTNRSLPLVANNWFTWNSMNFHVVKTQLPWKSLLFTMKSHDCLCTFIDFHCPFRLGTAYNSGS